MPINEPLTTFVLNDGVPQGLAKVLGAASERDVEMGTVVEFPVGAVPRREGESAYQTPRQGSATVVILPVVRIERYTEETRGDSGPSEGTTGRRRKRRARS